MNTDCTFTPSSPSPSSSSDKSSKSARKLSARVVISSQRALYVVLYFGSTVLTMPLWPHLSNLIGKHKVWCWAMVTASISFLCVIFLPEGSFVYFGIVCVITGMCLGADLSSLMKTMCARKW